CCVHTHDDELSARFRKWVPLIKIGATQNAKFQIKEVMQLAPPVPREAGRTENNCSSYPSTVDHLTGVKASLDGLAGARVVSEEVTKRILRQQMLVNRNPLVS